MTTNGRLSDGYVPDFDIDAAVGRQGELLMANVIDGMRDGSVEVKTDEKAASTGNVYVEFSCYRRGSWRDSGIALRGSETWVIVLGRIALVAPAEFVRSAARAAYREGRMRECVRGSHPTRGVVIPLDSLVSRLMAADREAA